MSDVMRTGSSAASLRWAGLVGLSTVFVLLQIAAGRPAFADARFTTSDQVQIRYLDSGPRDSKHTLLLIPGWRFAAEVWRHSIATFSPRLRVIAIDPRSQGASGKPLTGNTPERRAQDVHELLASLGVRGAVLVGWSQGVQDVAAYLGEFGSEGLAGVVLVDSPVAAGPAEVELNPQATKEELAGIALYAAHPVEYTQGMLRAIIKSELPAGELDALARTSLETPTDIAVSMLTLDMFGVDRRPNLARCDKPALVVAAADSPLLEAQKRTAQALHARFEPISGAGHAVFIDQPARFEAILGEFLDGLDGGK